MELLQLKQQQLTDAGLSLAPPSSFSAASFRSRPSSLSGTAAAAAPGRTPPAPASTASTTTGSNDESGSGSSSVEESDMSTTTFPLRKRFKLANDTHRSSGGEFALAGMMRDVDLHHSSQPLPLGWEQCLDLKSGEIYYCNPSLRLRTRQDPRNSGFTPIPGDGNDHKTSGRSTMSLLRTKRSSYSARLAQRGEHLDLSLNLSSPSSSPSQRQFKLEVGGGGGGGGGDVVAACRYCLRFVLLPREARDCSNCGRAVQATY